MQSDKNSLISEFKVQSISQMKESLTKIEKCVSMIDNGLLWNRPNKNLNSIGNLIIHLNGNITQYIISSLGGAKDQRDRDSEFEVSDGPNGKEIIALLRKTVKKATEIISSTSETELLKKRSVQAYHLTGMGIVIHVVEHLSYHTGQIVYMTKQLLDIDLGFYRGVDLNARNK